MVEGEAFTSKETSDLIMVRFLATEGNIVQQNSPTIAGTITIVENGELEEEPEKKTPEPNRLADLRISRHDLPVIPVL